LEIRDEHSIIRIIVIRSFGYRAPEDTKTVGVRLGPFHSLALKRETLETPLRDGPS
jgi:hypothetical protein